MRSLPLFGAPAARATASGPAIAAKGFRPFFLLAALFATIIVPAWVLALRGAIRVDGYLDPISWHAHEMVFGFGAAVIAGFLLTAVGNWTSRETATGPALLALAALWTAGRFALAAGSTLPPWIIAGVDLAFLPAVVLAVARPIVQARNKRNAVVVAALVAMWLANLAVHLDALGIVSEWRRRGIFVGVDVITLFMVLVSGRVVPMFTRNATGDASVRSIRALDVGAMVSIALLTLLDVVGSRADVAAAGIAALVIAARTRHWFPKDPRRVLRDPLLWILHVGHAWIPVGLALRVVARIEPAVPSSLATHAMTAGAIGALTLGMMARVALGHTGRALVAPRSMATAFGLITGSAVVRVLVPLALPGLYLPALVVSATLWACAFALYVAAYAPILVAPRVDGKPG